MERYTVLFLKEMREPFEVCIKAQQQICLGVCLEPCADLAINSYSTQGTESSARHAQLDHALIKLGTDWYLCVVDISDYIW